jgi:hypothetical protein
MQKSVLWLPSVADKVLRRVVTCGKETYKLNLKDL